MLSDEIDLLRYLSCWSFEFGILDQDGETPIKVFSFGSDGTKEEHSMKASEAMSLVEYGTVSRPGRFLLDKCLFRAKKILDNELGRLCDEILEGKQTEGGIEIRVREIALRLQDSFRNYVSSYPDKIAVLSVLEDENGETQDTCDLREIAKRIRCVAKFAIKLPFAEEVEL